MYSVKIPKTYFKRKYSKYLDNVDYAIAQTINATLFDSKKYFESMINVNFAGGATRYTKQQVRYAPATKQQPIGILFVTKPGWYIMRTMDGGMVKPFPGMTSLVQPVNVRLSKYGNLRRGYVTAKKTNSKFFIGTPKGRPKNDDYYGLWERLGRKGKGTIKMRVKLSAKSRVARKTFSGRQLTMKYAASIYNKKFPMQLAKAVASSQRA